MEDTYGAVELHKKVSAALEGLGVVVEALDEVHDTGAIVGFIVSNAFDDMDHSDRQRLLRSLLDKSLTPAESRRVGPIAALTPAEASVRA